MPGRLSLLRAFVPLGLTALLASALFVGSFVYGTRHIDGVEAQREEALVAGDVAPRLVELQATLNPFVIWDEAVQHLGPPFDAVWAQKNIGRSLTSNLGFSRVVVLDASNRAVFADAAAGPIPLGDVAELVQLSQPLVGQIRQAAADPVVSAKLHSIQASRVALADGRPVVLIASLVRPEFAAGRPAAAAPIVLTQAPVEGDLSRALADRFQLDNARVVVDAASDPHRAQITLAHAPDGRDIRLVWTPQKPGAELLQRSFPYLILAALALLGAAIALILHARRVARSLLDSRERAAHLAFHDPLTGLANRALLGERLESARRTTGRDGAGYAVLCLDLDRFKEVNDIYGHATGDELICEVATRLKKECRAGDTIARLGGDEFAIVMTGTTPAGAASLAARIVAQLAGPVELMSGRAILSCSVGACLIDDAGLEPLEALRQADMALYRAKAQGRGRYCFFEPEMDAIVKSKKALEDDLRLALTERKLEVVYQPIVHDDGEIVALEALTRWRDRARGNVAPSVFIPLAEDSGLISPLGEFVFRRVCEDSLAWPGVRLSVNLSPVQIRRPDLVDRIQKVLEETGADASRFDLEITEGCLLQDDSRTHEVLARLRAMGFGFSLDDFGTGYSSLSYLHRYPVQKIKLDRSFVSRLSEGPQGGLIVASLVLLARALDLKVIAEGVETQDQLVQLVDFGCNQYQGFLFSRPVKRDVVSRLIGRKLSIHADAHA